MCGIFGIVCRPGRFDRSAVERASATLAHRGPDGRGLERIRASEHWDLWLGHVRLSILDLSEAGAQPMMRAGGAIVFNGELYDHRAHRDRLRDEWRFESRTDTEVLLAGVLRDGPGFAATINAMMAAAVWDEARGHLALLRDRLGKKPLFVYRAHDTIVFASELKAIAALGLPLTLDEEALAYFRWLGYVPGERSIWREVQKLRAACTATLDLRQAWLPSIEPRPYWDPLAGARATFAGSHDDAIDAVLAVLDDATRLRLEADVPVGVFLSSGIDSGLVASSIARQHGEAITAFIVRTTRSELDESAAAARVARRLGLRVEVLEPDAQAYARQLRKVPWHFDEPHAASSQIAVMGNAELARRRVTVVLTGDGGDEVFLGYPWSSRPERIHRWARGLRALGLGAALVGALRTPIGRRAFAAALRAARLETETAGNKLDLLDAAASGRGAAALYEYFCAATPRSLLSSSDRALLGDEDLLARARRWYPDLSWAAVEARSVPELLGALDLVTYLRDDVLQKVDRGTMAYSIEARSPFLDYRMIELGLSLPLSSKLGRGVHKRVLRDAYARRIGGELARARKRGFSVDDPAELPAAPTRAMRWVAAIERGWRQTWLERGAELRAAATS